MLCAKTVGRRGTQQGTVFAILRFHPMLLQRELHIVEAAMHVESYVTATGKGTLPSKFTFTLMGSPACHTGCAKAFKIANGSNDSPI